MQGQQGESGHHFLVIPMLWLLQGREKEVIVFSAVRSNPLGSVGFLSDYRCGGGGVRRGGKGEGEQGGEKRGEKG